MRVDKLEVVVEIVGDTDYSGGIEYLISSKDVNNISSEGQVIPISIDVTVNNLNGALKSNVSGANGNDKQAYNDSDVTIITSTIPGLNRKLSSLFGDAITLV